jgi:hypothetical protein
VTNHTDLVSNIARARSYVTSSPPTIIDLCSSISRNSSASATASAVASCLIFIISKASIPDTPLWSPIVSCHGNHKSQIALLPSCQQLYFGDLVLIACGKQGECGRTKRLAASDTDILPKSSGDLIPFCLSSSPHFAGSSQSTFSSLFRL